MEVRVIKTSEPREQKKINVIAAGAVGAVSGFAVKYALPVSKEEINEFTDFQFRNIVNQKGLEAKKAELAELSREYKLKPELALDLFLKSKEECNAKTEWARRRVLITNRGDIRKATPEIRKKINEYARTVASKVKTARSSTEYLLASSAKDARPVAGFVVPGIILGIVVAFVYNVIGKFRES